MTRFAALAAAFTLLAAGVLPTAAQDKDKDAPKQPDPANPVKAATIEVYGANGNLDLSGGAPGVRVITTEKEWKELARAWAVANPAELDFKKEFIVVVTSRSGQVVVQAKMLSDGELRVSGLENGDTRGGFRYGIKSFSRDGVKTVNGKPLPPVESSTPPG